MLEPGFLKEVKASRFIKDDLFPDYRLQHLIGSRVLKPDHRTMQTTFHRTESRDNAILEILDMGEHFVFLHAGRKVYALPAGPVFKNQSFTR